MVAQLVFYGGGSLIFGGIGWLISAVLPDAVPRSLRLAVAVLTSAAPVVILATMMVIAALDYGNAAFDDPKLPVLLAAILPFAIPATLGTLLGLRSRSNSGVSDYPSLRQ